MFKDIYKSANDSVNPPPELMEKILNTRSKPRHNYYSVLKVAAALIIFSGTLVIYPKISENINPAKGETIIAPKISTSHVSPEVMPQNVSETKDSVTKAVPSTPAPAKKTQNAKKSTVKSEDTALPLANENDILLAAEPVSLETDGFEIATGIEEEQALEPATIEDKASGGGSSIKRTIMVSEHQAREIADREFLSDFGEDFITASDITVTYDNGYIVTRKSTEIEASIFIKDDGSFEKLY